MSITKRSGCCPKGNTDMTSYPSPEDYEPTDDKLEDDDFDDMEPREIDPEDLQPRLDSAKPLVPIVDPEEAKRQKQAQMDALIKQAKEMPIKPRPDYDRITVHFNLNHEQYGESPASFNHHSNRNLDSSDESYARKVKIKAGTKIKLDTGWVENPGTLVIENTTKYKEPGIPPKEIQEDYASRHIYVSMCEECPIEKALVIRPNCFMYVELGEQTEIIIQTLAEYANFNLFVLPK